MSDTPRTYKRKKHSPEAVAVATAIAEAVAEIHEEEMVQEGASPEPAAEEIPVAQYRAPVAVAAPAAASQRMVKVRATETIRGVYGNFRYAIEAGQTYSLPEPVATWLVSIKRAI